MRSDAIAAARLGRRSLERIGNTPLLRLERSLAILPGIELLGKAEWYNPGGSVKDRAASNIVAQARASGKFGARQDPARFHQRQHRHRLRHDRRRARLPSHAVHAGKCFASSASTSCMPTARTLSIPIPATDPTARFARRANSTPKHPDQVFLRRPVFQRRQLAGPLPWHSQRNLATDRRTRHAFCFHAGNQRNLHRHGAAPEGTESRRFAASRFNPTRPSTGSKAPSTWPAPSSPKFTTLQLADEDIGISTEDVLQHGQAPGPRRRTAGRDLGGCSGGGLSAGGARSWSKGERAVFVTILCDSGRQVFE